uniref:Uncharacterized protein n=1 Tax=Tanacetum cinerariifolium TaxID=118510 RepID=A0A6L2KZ35_TANCI|nr:hypothetical protein [Tanacetum cinerariifolium]
MTLEEIKEKFDPVWKQIQDFIPIGSKEESERFKRKGLRLEHDSSKKLKTSEEVPKEKLKEMMELVPVEEVYVEALQVKHPIIDCEVHTEGERSYRKITRLRGSSASYQFFVDLLKLFDREDLNQLWALVKESLSIRPATSDKEMGLWVELKRQYEPDVEDQLWTHTQNMMHALVEWKLYDMCRVHHVIFKDQEIFMLVKKDYPLRKASSLGEDCWEQNAQGIPTGSDEFPLPQQLPTAYEDNFPLLIQSDTTIKKIALLLKTWVSHGQRYIYTIQRRMIVTQLFRESVP